MIWNNIRYEFIRPPDRCTVSLLIYGIKVGMVYMRNKILLNTIFISMIYDNDNTEIVYMIYH